MDTTNIIFKQIDNLESKVDSITNKIDTISHMTDTLRLFQNEVHSLLYKFDSLQKEIIELSHLESRLIPKFDNRYMRREEARPIMREAIIEHLDMQLDRMNKKASTLGAVVQVVQILFPFVVAFGILVN